MTFTLALCHHGVMTTNAFKGNKGGDPSRRPAKVKMNVPCAHCGTNVEFLGKGKETLTLFCSEVCKTDRRKNEIVSQLRKYGINLKVNKNRGLSSLNALLKASETLDTVSKGKKIYESRSITCATCKGSFTYLSMDPIKNEQAYCSSVCRKNRASRVVKVAGIPMCPRPEKMKFGSLADADKHLRSMMDDDIARNRDLVPYLCICGNIHFGSKEKAVFEKEERRHLEKKQAELHALLKSKPHLKVKSRA